MLLSEEEAKLVWCPYARIIIERDQGEARVSGNRWMGEQAATNSPTNSECLGSGCMAWRWRDGVIEARLMPPGDPPPLGDGWEQADDEPGALRGHNAVMTRWVRQTPVRRGYCGLAGNP